MCQCGCNQTISSCSMEHCHSAEPIREEIWDRLGEGESIAGIVEMFKERYGLVILSAPPTEGFHLTAWFMPILAFVFGVLVIGRRAPRVETADGRRRGGHAHKRRRPGPHRERAPGSELTLALLATLGAVVVAFVLYPVFASEAPEPIGLDDTQSGAPRPRREKKSDFEQHQRPGLRESFRQAVRRGLRILTHRLLGSSLGSDHPNRRARATTRAGAQKEKFGEVQKSCAREQGRDDRLRELRRSQPRRARSSVSVAGAHSKPNAEFVAKHCRPRPSSVTLAAKR